MKFRLVQIRANLGQCVAGHHAVNDQRALRVIIVAFGVTVCVHADDFPVGVSGFAAAATVAQALALELVRLRQERVSCHVLLRLRQVLHLRLLMLQVAGEQEGFQPRLREVHEMAAVVRTSR